MQRPGIVGNDLEAGGVAGDGAVDWTIGGEPLAPEDHAEQAGMATPAPPLQPGELARVIATARRLAVAPPVPVAPPRQPSAPWSIMSDGADRPLRAEAKIDGASGRVLSQKSFAQRHWIDRLIGYGIAVHEVALFRLANQISAR